MTTPTAPTAPVMPPLVGAAGAAWGAYDADQLRAIAELAVASDAYNDHPGSRAKILSLVARHPNTPADVLGTLADHPDRDVREEVVRRPAAPEGALRRIAALAIAGWGTGADIVSLSVLLGNSATPSDVIADIATGDWELRRSAAAHPNLPANTAVSLAEQTLEPTTDVIAADARTRTAEALATNPATPEQALLLLAGHPSPRVRAWLRMRADLPADAATVLALAGTPAVPEAGRA